MLPPISAHLIKFTRIDKGESVLDIACGNGNTAITARIQGADVTGVDIRPELLSVAVEEEKIAKVSGISGKKVILKIYHWRHGRQNSNRIHIQNKCKTFTKKTECASLSYSLTYSRNNRKMT